MLSIGTEMNSLESPSHESRWRELIGDVRSHFDGQLTYAANHSDALGFGGGYQRVPWWEDLDYIGIDAYFALSDRTDPSRSELLASWKPQRGFVRVP
jgi:hypothetical protein